MARPHGTTGSLRPTFVPARPVASRRQAPFCLCTRRAITDRTEGTFARLRYSFGGDRPSQTTHLPRSSPRVSGRVRIVTKTRVVFHCWLPPGRNRRINASHLCYAGQADDPMTGYSKGARGLFVLSRVIGILTDTAVSPSSRTRQPSSRYAIRAGRNLPDKEFRYLRTVIVTAAVYRGFGSQLRLAANLSP